MSNRGLKSSAAQKGFTLIEMSIVLVIIGLIIGGILKGQELIESSRQKNLISQIDAVRSATTTFTDRYRALPGDYGSAVANISATTANGNDNGVVAAAAAPYPATEAAIIAVNGAAASSKEKEFFNHLAAAGMLGGAATMAPATAAPGFSGGTAASPLPQAAFPQSGLTITYGTHPGAAANGQSVAAHWLRLSRFVAGGITTAQAAVSPQRMQQMDIKFDDGLPEGGTIRTGGISLLGGTECGVTGTNAYTGTATSVSCVVLFEVD